MSLDDLQRHKPYHHKNIQLLDKVIKQIKIDFDNGDLTPVYLLLDHIHKHVLESFLPEEA